MADINERLTEVEKKLNVFINTYQDVHDSINKLALIIPIIASVDVNTLQEVTTILQGQEKKPKKGTKRSTGPSEKTTGPSEKTTSKKRRMELLASMLNMSDLSELMEELDV